MLRDNLKEIERAICQIHFATLDMRSLGDVRGSMLEEGVDENRIKMILTGLQEETKTIEYLFSCLI